MTAEHVATLLLTAGASAWWMRNWGAIACALTFKLKYLRPRAFETLYEVLDDPDHFANLKEVSAHMGWDYYRFLQAHAKGWRQPYRRYRHNYSVVARFFLWRTLIAVFFAMMLFSASIWWAVAGVLIGVLLPGFVLLIKNGPDLFWHLAVQGIVEYIYENLPDRPVAKPIKNPVHSVNVSS